MAYSLAVSQAISILLYICVKIESGKIEYLSTKSISHYLNIPVPTASKVIKSLNSAGLIMTKEGARGGIQLAKKPSEITLLDIFIAIEQERPLFKVQVELEVKGERVDSMKEKALKSLKDAEMSMKHSLEGVTLNDLLN